MKIRVERIVDLPETEVLIRCQEETDQIKNLVKTIEAIDEKIIAKRGERFASLPIRDVFYFESVDDKTYLYTDKEVFECSLKLYELEENYQSLGFLRVNKNTVMNTNKIKTFHSTVNGRMIAKLKNAEEIVISRTYVSALKLVLGGKLS